MSRLIIGLFVFSIVATSAIYYWRTVLPEGRAVSTRSAAPAPSAGNTRPDRNNARPAQRRNAEENSSSESGLDDYVPKTPSERQDFAMVVSVASSIISAFAALLQTWLMTRRRD